MKTLLLSFIAAAAIVGGCATQSATAADIKSDTTTAGSASAPKPVETTAAESNKPADPTQNQDDKTNAPVAIKPGDAPNGLGRKAVITTNYGVIEFEFLSTKAPETISSFIKLANRKFYDGTTFHRVIKGFMIQGGDPNTKPGNEKMGPPGTGGPGYQLKAEFNDTKHVPGIVSMARSQDPDSAGSQFFIMHGTNPGLDGQYTAFGKVIKGMDVVNKIAQVETGQQDDPIKPVIMQTVRVVKK